ncbi:MAG: hypothetical protein QG586_781, partial [Pseudomonadota bacterium]|nr:hypothetical protein [Pseudomonadota bacterium]
MRLYSHLTLVAAGVLALAALG